LTATREDLVDEAERFGDSQIDVDGNRCDG
jgi:hypothetical protein